MLHLTISRHWDHPRITTDITSESISLKISLDDFVTALEQEIGSVTWTFTKATFHDQIMKAAEAVVAKVKEESAKVVAGR